MPSARQIAWAKTRVFSVTIASAAIFLVLVFLLSGGTWFQPRVALYIYIPDATGLSAGAPVRVSGIGVGSIKNVSLSGSEQPDRIVKLTLSIDQQYLAGITAGSYAQTETESAIGNEYIEIHRGPGAVSIPPGGEIPFRPQPTLIETQNIEQLTKQVRAVEALLDQIEQGKNPTGELLLSDRLYNQAREEIATFQTQITRLRNPRNPVGKLLYTDDAYRQFREPLVRLDRAVVSLESAQSPIGKLLRENTQYNALMTSLTGLRGSIAKLQTDPFFNSDEAFTSWNRELASLIQSVDQFQISPLLSTSELYDNLTGFATGLRNNLHDFRNHPQKYLRLKIF